MTNKLKILFVCLGNVNRSPSFERWFKKNRPQYDVKSAGTYYGYPTQLTNAALEWADIVLTMDLEQEMFIAEHYPDQLPKVETIGVSDDYQPDSPEITRLIEYWVEKKTGL
jgi:protein-tyrosine-phosphatase